MANQAKSYEEVVELLNKINGVDQEAEHHEADMLLCDALLLAGQKEVVDAWLAALKRVEFWYA